MVINARGGFVHERGAMNLYCQVVNYEFVSINLTTYRLVICIDALLACICVR
jgi:hypothetical protein